MWGAGLRSIESWNVKVPELITNRVRDPLLPFGSALLYCDVDW